jgi:hypothetical protein
LSAFAAAQVPVAAQAPVVRGHQHFTE